MPRTRRGVFAARAAVHTSASKIISEVIVLLNADWVVLCRFCEKSRLSCVQPSNGLEQTRAPFQASESIATDLGVNRANEPGKDASGDSFEFNGSGEVISAAKEHVTCVASYWAKVRIFV